MTKHLCAVVLVAMLWLVAPKASANTVYPNQGLAYAGCMSNATEAAARPNASFVGCRSATLGYTCEVNVSGNGVGCGTAYPTLFHDWHSYPEGQLCTARAEEFGWSMPAEGPLGGVCYQGCAYSGALDHTSPTGVSYAPTGSVCTTADLPQPTIDTDGDGVPDEDDAFPNDPNESADSDGDGIGDNADFSPDDETDGADDGEGNESDNDASGGGNCDAPPTCKGDAIACNTNYQVWKMRCSGATVTGSPQVCNAAYTCAGDSAQCAQIALLRKSACATPGTGGGSGFGTGDSGNLQAIKDALTGQGEGVANVSMPWIDGAANEQSWSSGLGGGTCPAPISTSVTVAGYTANLEFSFSPLCQFASLFQAITIAMAAIMSGFIIAGVRK